MCTNSALKQKVANHASLLYNSGSNVDSSLISAFNKGADYVLDHMWISTSNSTPDTDRGVLVRDSDGNVYFDNYYNHFSHLNVTHWMDIPSLSA